MFHLWKRSRFSFKMFTGFGLVALIYLGSSLYIFKQVTYLNKVIYQATDVDVPMALAGKDMEYELLAGHLALEELMSGDDSISPDMVHKPWEIALSYANAMLTGGAIEAQTFLAVTDPEETTLLRSFVKNTNLLLSLANNRINTQDRIEEAGAGSNLDQAFDAVFLAALEPMKELEARFVNKSVLSTHEADEVSRDVRNHLMMVMALVLLSCIIIPFIFSHYIVVRPLSFLQKSCTALSSSASTMATHAREQEAAAIEQETTTQQIAASTREISATSQELVRSMEEVAQVVDSTSKLAKGGRGNLTRMEKTIGQMMDASKNIGAKLSLLNEKASNITTVVTTINKVADQTNLLSVNAAIEADKAGEYGLGFGTVASEIRRLSDQTAIATSDIEEMVKEMQAAVSAGVMGMESFSSEIQHGVEDVQQVGQQLAQIIERVQTLGPHFEVVHEGMSVQAEGAEQISESIDQLSETMRITSTTTNESQKIIDQLNEESTRMREAVARFNLGPSENAG